MQEWVLYFKVGMRRGEDIYVASWRLFCSLRLTAWILACLLIGCIAGMFWDQTLSWQQQVDALQGRPVVLWFLFLFELGDAFHSWWFSALVLLLALNLMACSIQRLPPIWIAIRDTPRRLSDALLRTATHKYVCCSSLPRETVNGVLRSVLPNAQCDVQGNVTHWFVHKHRFARLGVYVIHTALLVILFASLLQTSCGVTGTLLLTPGQPTRVLQARGPAGVLYEHDLKFWVRCDGFHLSTFADGSAREFASKLVVWRADASVAQGVHQTVRVGDPLHYSGYTLYQTSYQRLPHADRIQLSVVYAQASDKAQYGLPHAVDSVKHAVTVGRPLRLRDGSALVAVQIIDNYEGFGPAVRLRHVQQDGRKNHFTVFRDYPGFDQHARPGSWHVVLHEIQPQYATGISVSKTSLVPFVFAGFALLFVGLCMTFCMQDRRFYARVRALDDGRCEVALAGFVHRRRASQFPQQFATVVGCLQSKLSFVEESLKV